MSRKPISSKLRYAILARDGFACQCCGAKAPDTTLHVDHIVPVSRGGTDREDNLRAVCVTCNLGKSDAETSVVRIPTFKGPIVTADNEVVVRGEPLSEPIFWIGRQWAVTAYGIECRDGTYFIEASRLWEGTVPDQDGHTWPWERHMAEKEWVDMTDFRAAIAWAREHFNYLRKNRARAIHGL